MQKLMKSSSDKFSHVATMEDFSESTFRCEVPLVSLSKVPHIEKSNGFKSDKERAHFSLDQNLAVLSA
uniref:Uncharacterized protein n=1 Tax=Lepeophtheirus salmonis TaxID=72036 RepID=A0A0K2U770_LEPSM